MAYPTVKFNSTSGSDTQASGAGPATALFGTAASFAGSVVTLDGSPDLSGVAVDSSHVLWMLTSTGRQFFAITAKANSGTPTAQVTVADAPAGTSTGRTWGIGGKRQTLNATSSRNLFTQTVGAKPGWTIDIEAAADYVLTTELDISIFGNSITDGSIKIYSSSGTKPVITSSTSGINLFDIGFCYAVIFQNLKFTHTGATRGFALGSYASMTQFCWFDNIEIDGCLIGIRGSYTSDWAYQHCHFTRIQIKNCTSHGIDMSGEGNTFAGCYIHHNAGSGLHGSGGSNLGLTAIVNCLITNNTGRGIYWNTSADGNVHARTVVNCTIANNGSDGIRILDTAAVNNRGLSLVNCIIYGNTGWGVHVDYPSLYMFGNNNAYGANSSGNRNGYVALPGEVDLIASPFTAALDYSLNNTAGGGAACRGAGFPGTIDSLIGYNSMGALQISGSGGGGGGGTKSYGA